MREFEIGEAMEGTERFGAAELQEQREALRLQADAAREAGNEEKANYFQGQAAKLEQQLAELEAEGAVGEVALGEGHAGGHSESYWRKAAAKELAEHGKTTWYYSCKKYLEQAIENDVK